MKRGLVAGAVAAVLGLMPGPAPAHAADAPCRPGARYRGHRIDLDLRSADLVDTFRMLADVGNASVVVPATVTGTVTVRLRRVPWDQALCVIAASRGLRVARDRGVYVVTAS